MCRKCARFSEALRKRGERLMKRIMQIIALVLLPYTASAAD